MDSISKNMLLEIAFKLPVKALHKLSLIGFNHLFDNRFWQRYCIKRNIVLSTYPWIKRAYLWEKRRPVWTILDETPWDPESQNPKVIWGLDDNQVIEYVESETASAIVLNDIEGVIDSDINSNGATHTTDTGFYETKCIEKLLTIPDSNGKLTEKLCKVIYFVRYCPYDQCHVGYCIINDNNLLFHINKSISYSGEVSDGLRQGSGILTFENGFIVDSDDLKNDDNDESDGETEYDGLPWNDKYIVNSNIGANLAGLSFITMSRLSQILERYIYWCSQVGIFKSESI